MNHVCISDDVKLGKDVKLSKFINLYGCCIGDNTKIGAFVEIQKSAFIGNNCKISSHTFVCEGVTIEDDVFVGHNVAFDVGFLESAFNKTKIVNTMHYHRLDTIAIAWAKLHNDLDFEHFSLRELSDILFAP